MTSSNTMSLSARKNTIVRLRSRLRFLRWHLGHTIPMIVSHSSTYPELPRKPKFRRLVENLYIYLRDGAPCAAYDGLGLDVKGRKLNDFVGNIAWIRFLLRHFTVDGMESATPMQKLTQIGTCPILLLQDKFCFWSFMDRHGIPVVPILAHTVGGKLVKGEEAMPKLRSRERFFAKPVAANCGSRASIVVVKDGDFTVDGEKISFDQLIEGGDDFIFQPVIENHADIKEINPSSLNTLRLVTCRRKDGTLELWGPGMMRIGRANATVDNFAKGGIGVGIDLSGRLKKYGYSHDRELNYDKTERLTIDYDVHFHNMETGNDAETGPLVIIELKRDGNVYSPVLEILRTLRIKPSGFSKYCIGSVMTNKSLKRNIFKAKMVTLSKLANTRIN